MVKTDHIRLRPLGASMAFVCLSCGVEYTLPLPVELSLASAAARAFIASHRRCAKPVVSTRPVCTYVRRQRAK